MTKIKLCGLSRERDIEAANELMPEYVGFVFAPKSRRYVTPETAKKLRSRLLPNIKAVGVFVDESCETVAKLLCGNIIDIAHTVGFTDAKYFSRIFQKKEGISPREYRKKVLGED